MKRRAWILVLGAIAVVAGLLLWRGRAPSSKRPASPAAEEGHRHGSGTTPIDEPELREGPGRVIADDDPAGALRLEGQVLDEGEHPVADATVWLSSQPPRQTKSGADGSFSFDALLARPYTLAAVAPTGVAGPVTARLTATSDPVVLRLRQGGRVEVEVVDSRQQPVAQASVELRGPAEQAAQAPSGKAVFAQVVPGPYQVVAWAEGYGRAYQPVAISVGTTALRLELARGAPVSGRVVNEQGAPVAGARVRYDAAADFGPGASGGTGSRDAVTTSADGAFSFAAMPAGSFRFLATHADYATGISALISLDGQSAKTEVEVKLGPGAVVSGKVVDAQGRPVSSARVRVGIAAPGFRTTSPPREGYSDAAGLFTVRGLPRRELAAVALHELGASATQALDASAGEVRDLVLTIDATGVLAGVVVDSAGQPVEGAQVSAMPDLFGRRRGQGGPPARARDGDGAAGAFLQWQLRGFPQELTDADGRFRLTGLLPGAYRVHAARSAAVSRGRGMTGDGVVAEVGNENLRVVLPAEGALRAKVAFADGSKPERFTAGLGFSQQAFSNGELALDSLTPQRYQLVLRGPSFETRVLEALVEAGKTTDLGTILVVKGRRLGGLVLAEGKPVAGATVIAGPQVMGSGSSSENPLMRRGLGGAKSTTTGSDGTFVLEGFADIDLTVVAEHPSLGRSRAVVWARGSGQDVVRLSLLPLGSLRGSVQREGKPQEGVMVIAQSVTASTVMYTVSTGPDGVFRFDKLAPDVYKVSATVGFPLTGMKQFSKQAEVTSGKETVVELAVVPGAVSLEVKVTAQSGEPGLVGWVLAPGRVNAATSKELRAATATSGPGASQLGMGTPPIKIAEVAPGNVTLCVIPYPRELDNPMQLMLYAERFGEQLAVVCKPLEVRAAPATQALEVAVTVPPLLEAPGGPGGGPGGGSGSNAPR